jgi:acetolactate synthase I/II/III large subunit
MLLSEVAAETCDAQLPWLHGGDLVAAQLAAEGVDKIFTLTGGHISPIYDGARFAKIRLVDFRHEQAAVHCADAYARLTRRVACAALTAGPGVTGGITGVANALYGQSPVVVLGGSNPLSTLGAGNLQEAPHLDLMRPITKYCTAVLDYGRSRDIIHEAAQASLSPRPGPSYVDLPMDFQLTRLPCDLAPPVRAGAARPIFGPEYDLIRDAARLCAQARRPVILGGTGVYWAGAWDALAEFASVLSCPVFLNGMARGCLGRSNPNQLTRGRARALSEADLVIMLGADFDFRLGYGQPGVVHPEAAILQVDPQPTALAKNRDVSLAVCSDIDIFLRDILALSAAPTSLDREWVAGLQSANSAAAVRTRTLLDGDQSPIHPERFIAEVAEFFDESAIVIGDGGDIVGAFAGVFQPGSPGGWLDPGPFGCLGVGAPFAMGARLACPERPVAVLFGDGAFGFNAFEYDSAVRQNLPFVGIIGNDGAWSEMRTFHADLFGEDDSSAQYLSQDTRYELVVEGLGGSGERVERASQIRPALKRAFESGVPALVNVILDPTVRRKSATISGRQVAAAYGEGDPDAFHR